MVTVRFPNGQAVQYNRGYFVEKWGNETITLRVKEGGEILAKIPTTCIIEWGSPCRVYNALKSEPDEAILKELKAINRKLKKLEGK